MRLSFSVISPQYDCKLGSNFHLRTIIFPYLITVLVAHVLEDVRGSVNPRDLTLLDL